VLKSVQLKFAKVKYRGNSIGDDIRIETEIPDYPHPGGRNYLDRSAWAMT
jgi:hypothetical protein